MGGDGVGLLKTRKPTSLTDPKRLEFAGHIRSASRLSSAWIANDPFSRATMARCTGSSRAKIASWRLSGR